MIDETKPPSHWCLERCDGTGAWCGVRLNGTTGYFKEECEALSEVHRISREEAQPYVDEALGRIADYLEACGRGDAPMIYEELVAVTAGKPP